MNRAANTLFLVIRREQDRDAFITCRFFSLREVNHDPLPCAQSHCHNSDREGRSEVARCVASRMLKTLSYSQCPKCTTAFFCNVFPPSLLTNSSLFGSLPARCSLHRPRSR